MATVTIDEDYLYDIGDAIREKRDIATRFKKSQMGDAIRAIPTGIIQQKTITENGTYTATSEVDGYAPVIVNVPNSYGESDEGKVVSNGALVAQTSQSITANGTYNTTTKNQAVVNVPNSYTSSDEGKVVSSGALVGQTSTTKTANGTYDTTTNDEVVIDVPNTYTESDEGKVVDDGALVTQGSQTITQNGTYDTTLISQLIANISGGGGGESSTFNFPAYLAHSDQSKIAVSAKYDDYVGNSTVWENLVLSGAVSKEDYYLRFNGVYGYFDLENSNTDVTIYAIVRQYDVQSGDKVAISNNYSFSNNRSPSIYSTSGTLKSTVWGGDVTLGDARDWHVIAMSIVGGSSVSFYIDGVLSNTKTLYNNGSKAYINFNDNSSTIGRWDVMFCGVVKETEAQATVIANQEDLMAILDITKLLYDYSDYIDTPVIAGAEEPQSAIGENGNLFVEYETINNITSIKDTYNKINGVWVKNT